MGVVILVILVSQRRRQETVAPKALNHQGKLLREVLKSVPLKESEVKLLRRATGRTPRGSAAPGSP